MLIHEATPEDWPAIYPIFRAVTDEGATYVYPAGLSSEEARALWTGQGHVVVAVEDDGDARPGTPVLGTAVMQPNRLGRGAHVATGSFMVSGAARGRGVGRALGEHLVGLHVMHRFLR